MPNFKPNTHFRMDGFTYPGTSPNKTRLGRWLMGRKKHVGEDGSVTITDKRGRVVKTKLADGTKVKYARRNRPAFKRLAQQDKYIMGDKAHRIKHGGSRETL